VDQALIDRIVANVLEQLQPAMPRAVAAVTAETKSTAIELSRPVITADLLNEQVKPGQAVCIGPKSLLTPSAKDWLRQHQVDWQRGSTRGGDPSSPVMRGQLLLSAITPTARGAADIVFRSLPHWQRQIVGDANEAAEAAVRALTAAECDRVLLTSSNADLVACLANRSRTVRAAVVTSAEHVRRLEACLSPNLWIVDPAGRSLMELRNIFRSCVALGRPHPKAI